MHFGDLGTEDVPASRGQREQQHLDREMTERRDKRRSGDSVDRLVYEFRTATLVAKPSFTYLAINGSALAKMFKRLKTEHGMNHSDLLRLIEQWQIAVKTGLIEIPPGVPPWRVFASRVDFLQERAKGRAIKSSRRYDDLVDDSPLAGVA